MSVKKLEGASKGLGIASAFFPMFAPLLMGLSGATGIAGAKKRGDEAKKAFQQQQAAAAATPSATTLPKTPLATTTPAPALAMSAPAKPFAPAIDTPVAPETAFAKGGRIDGCARRGKTRGRIL